MIIINCVNTCEFYCSLQKLPKKQKTKNTKKPGPNVLRFKKRYVQLSLPAKKGSQILVNSDIQEVYKELQ